MMNCLSAHMICSLFTVGCVDKLVEIYYLQARFHLLMNHINESPIVFDDIDLWT